MFRRLFHTKLLLLIFVDEQNIPVSGWDLTMFMGTLSIPRDSFRCSGYVCLSLHFDIVFIDYADLDISPQRKSRPFVGLWTAT